MQVPADFFDLLKDTVSFELFRINNSIITVGTFLKVIIGSWFVLAFASFLNRLLKKVFEKRYASYRGLSHTIATFIKYTVSIIGLVIVFQMAGINLRSFAIALGALGVGIGFGLQNITSNFISGLIILLERPIRIGDRVELPELDHLMGDIVDISARATTIVTNDNVSIIVPNSKFISEPVINWSFSSSITRVSVPVSVSYKSDPDVVEKILLEVAFRNEGVLKTPKPDVLFEGFGESSLNFTLRAYTAEYLNRIKILRSQLYFSIFRRFKEQGIEIPFPQRDIHFKNADDLREVMRKEGDGSSVN